MGTDNDEPALVGVKNRGPLKGEPHVNEGAELVSQCGTIVGAASEASTYNAVSADGSVVYFTALRGAACPLPTVNELYARIDGSQTVAISEPSKVDCEMCDTSSPRGAVFEGASEDGSKVFFLSEQKLLPGAKGENLYEYDFDAAQGKRVVLLAGEVPGVARISEDGSHVYFVAKEKLTGNAEEGAYNLYVYDTVTGSQSFVATLMTQDEAGELQRQDEERREVKQAEEAIQAKSQAIKEKEGECAEERKEGKLTEAEACEAEVEASRAELREAEAHLTEKVAAVVEEVAAQAEERTRVTRGDTRRPFETTPDGRFLLFESARRLTGAEDTSTVRQLFEYDAQRESLVRVSIGERSPAFPEGYNDDGNTTVEEDAPTMLTPVYVTFLEPTMGASALSLSEDGRVFFTSRDALTPQAVPGSGTVYVPKNVYEYSNGNVHLVFAGGEAAPLDTEQSQLLGTDEAGDNVFFYTSESLVPQDTDTQAHWYDAREGGGFPAPVTPSGCEGDACQGSLGVTPSLPSPGGSQTTTGGGNLAPVIARPAVKRGPLTRVQKLSEALKACRKKPKKRRRSCEAQARKKYDPRSKATKSDRREK